MSLVVKQTPDVQEQVQELLSALRRLLDVEVATEVRILSVSESTLERLGVKVGDNTPGGVAFLSEKQLRALLEAIQGDASSNVMQAPKLTTFNGQRAVIEVADRQTFITGVEISSKDGQVVACPKSEVISTGTKIALRPTVSADRRHVHLTIETELRSLDSVAVPLFPVTVPLKGSDGKEQVLTQFIQQPKVTTLALEKSLAIPDGTTAVLGGWTRTREVQTEYGPPVLSKIPYLSRLYRNVGYARESERVLVLVTPRVIVQEEEEKRAER